MFSVFVMLFPPFFAGKILIHDSRCGSKRYLLGEAASDCPLGEWTSSFVSHCCQERTCTWPWEFLPSQSGGSSLRTRAVLLTRCSITVGWKNWREEGVQGRLWKGERIFTQFLTLLFCLRSLLFWFWDRLCSMISFILKPGMFTNWDVYNHETHEACIRETIIIILVIKVVYNLKQLLFYVNCLNFTQLNLIQIPVFSWVVNTKYQWSSDSAGSQWWPYQVDNIPAPVNNGVCHGQGVFHRKSHKEQLQSWHVEVWKSIGYLYFKVWVGPQRTKQNDLKWPVLDHFLSYKNGNLL